MGIYEQRRSRALALADAAQGYARALSPEREDRPELPWMCLGVDGVTNYSRQARRAREREEEKDPRISSDLRAALIRRPTPDRGLYIRGRGRSRFGSRFGSWES